MNTIRASRAASSAGSTEVLCAFKTSSPGLAECLSVVSLSGGSQCLGLVLALCAALCMVISLEWCALLASRALSCLSTAYVLCKTSRGLSEGVVAPRDA